MISNLNALKEQKAAGFHLIRLKSNKHPSDSKSLQWHMILMDLGVLQALLVRLRDGRLKTFRDEEELERGQSIKPSLLEAIEESRSAIVVLSPSYASSTWCLDELQKIIHLKEESSLQVFPIFYGVDPSDVKKQKGSFAEAFKKHEERFTKDKMKLQGWRDALEKVATISGWHSQNRHETEFIESISEEMMSKLLDESPSDLGILVGIKQKLDELESIVASELEGVRFIGIWGTYRRLRQNHSC
ncbi:hypothetical protein K1719_026327 [Acacia pycnantha]|nr:hypothetical protein K1719_026327 [Acacia pycnantha]